MIIDAHRHIDNDYESILKRMDELAIDRTVLVGIGVKDLKALTIKDSFIFKSHFLLRTLGMWKARRLLQSRLLKSILLLNPRNDKVLEAMQAYPDRFSGFVFINTESPDAKCILEKYLNLGMKGIKLALQQYPTRLDSENMMAVICKAREHNVPLFIHLGISQTDKEITQMIAENPDIKFIFAHAGVQYFYLAEKLAKEYDNLFLDTSSFFVSDAKLKYLYCSLGAGKLILGSDCPVMARDPSEAIAKINRLTLPPEGKNMIMGENFNSIIS